MKLSSLLIIALAVAGMFAIGWISFNSSGTEANIRIDTKEIKEDTGKAIEKGKALIDGAKESLDGAATEDGGNNGEDQSASSDSVEALDSADSRS